MMENFRIYVNLLLHKWKQFLGNNKHVRHASIIRTSALMLVLYLTSNAANSNFLEIAPRPFVRL